MFSCNTNAQVSFEEKPKWKIIRAENFRMVDIEINA